MSLGHSFIPHHHHSVEVEHHHHSADETSSAHDHIAHDGHFDENFVDYLACVFGDHQHESNEPCIYFEEINVSKNKISTDKDNSTNVVVVPGIIFNFHHSKKHKYYCFFSTKHSVLVSAIGKRGPPTA